jgi:hypothetical protein
VFLSRVSCVSAQGFAERKGMDEESPDTPGPAAYKMDDNAEAKIYTRYGKNCACLALESPVCTCRPLLTRTCLHMQTWATTTALGRSTTGNNGRKRMHTGVASSQSKAAKVGRQSEWLTQRQAQTRRRTHFRGRSDLTTESEAGTPPVFYAPRAGWAALQVALCVGCLVWLVQYRREEPYDSFNSNERLRALGGSVLCELALHCPARCRSNCPPSCTF